MYGKMPNGYTLSIMPKDCKKVLTNGTFAHINIVIY
jgi:hypothetical protein